ncbi:MAG: thiamine pyrophosphate-binding protein [Chloroflexi bacterium]|nr:thiamine pyrophosphate-binding protein [Chloroflexota bacterium]
MPRMTGKRALIEQLLVDGVRHIFGNPGTTEQGFMDILQDYPQIEFMLALHEGVAVCMADAYARVTGRPSFVELHIAPGLGNALGMLHNARVGKSPMVVYAGQSASRALFEEPHLTGPLVEMARPICKWAAQIEHAHDIPQALRRAFKIADEPPKGPVFLALPIDTLDAEADIEIVATSYTRWRSRPDPAALAEAADLLLAAERPMMMLGDGVAVSEAHAEAVEVAELLGAPMFECYASEFTAPASHPLNLGSVNFVGPDPLRKVLADCDLLLAVGAPLFQVIFPEPGRPILSAETRLVQIDTNTWELGKNVPADVALLADPKGALGELAELLRERQTPEGAAAAGRRRAAVAERTHASRGQQQARARANWDNTPISAPRLMHEISEALPSNGTVFAEAVTNGQALQAALRPEEPGRLLRGRGGGIGPGLPGSLGVQLAMPDRKVVGVCSDGAAMYSITALWTAAHHRIPVTYVMLNNASYRILKLNMVEYLGSAARDRRFVAMDLTDPELRFDRMAEAMGVPAWRVEHPDQIGPALREALAVDGPSLVDVVMEGPVPMP